MPILRILPKVLSRDIAKICKWCGNGPGLTALMGFLELNSWTYNFVEVSGHNLKSSQTWGFRIQCLHYKPVSNHFCSRGKGGNKIPLKRWIARRKLFCPNYVQENSLWKVYARVSVFMIVKKTARHILLTQLHSWVLGLILGENGTKTRTQNETEASIESCRSNNRASIFKRVWGPGIDSKERIPPAYVAWQAGTITLFLLGS